MLATLPALSYNGLLPPMPAAVASPMAVMLVLLGLLCAAAAILVCSRRSGQGGRRAARHRDRSGPMGRAARARGRVVAIRTLRVAAVQEAL